ncbi:hypothetical protein GCM10025867_51430 (plasmid) [Frondihabitans sucicola]|uniref:Uncharacterized protein n=1 Tax=Frondihabitans sucicola TaxID=1268041 RepID=A0ABM8GVB9_9MICO|nr:hypothetical protein [Frondihabitans sucicola]BDZ52335.1 hypothetical protein GCM10025867_45760 [Frondihabitans sucicola]BDZ52902.1 hypothetical protein GCM10025867_51430 [Frondihabitans sucicola]
MTDTDYSLATRAAQTLTGADKARLVRYLLEDESIEVDDLKTIARESIAASGQHASLWCDDDVLDAARDMSGREEFSDEERAAILAGVPWRRMEDVLAEAGNEYLRDHGLDGLDG